MVWFILWLLLSGALLYFLGWTLYILFRQKRAWKIFANQKKLRYKSDRFLDSPEMNGAINERTFSFFIAEHMAADARSSRKLSAIEVRLVSKMPFEGAIASGGMVGVVQGLRFRDEAKPDHPKWDKNYIAAASNRMALEAYLTPERLDALTSLMKIRNSWAILIFRGDTMLLRFDTADALDTQEKLTKIVQKLLDVAGILELRKGEDGVLKAEMAKTPKKAVNIAIDERDIHEAAAIQLEDDHKAKPPKE